MDLYPNFFVQNIFDFSIQGRFGAIVFCSCLGDCTRWGIWGAYVCGSTSVGRQIHTTQGG